MSKKNNTKKLSTIQSCPLYPNFSTQVENEAWIKDLQAKTTQKNKSITILCSGHSILKDIT